jgi:Reverse transcriptase (RNA-dependent DNA polymerase)
MTTANQLPFQPTLFQQLGHKKYFAKVDNLWGYHQLRLTDDSSKVTAIITPWGVNRFLACPFGISTAPGEYEARIQEILKPFYSKGAIFYIDDTVINGDIDSFLSILDQVLGEMARHNVRLIASKCFFGMESIDFLGHVFNLKA